MPQFTPFRVELGRVSIFDKTRVIYLELLQGTEELKAIHSELNQGPLHYNEPYQYHPHVTLAQGPVVVNDIDERKYLLAKERWDEFRLPKTFTVDTVMFVQNGGCQGWLDLDELPVGTPVSL